MRDVLYLSASTMRFPTADVSLSQTFRQQHLDLCSTSCGFIAAVSEPRLVANGRRAISRRSSKTQGNMIGSARLVWPADEDQVLGLKWLLVQNLRVIRTNCRQLPTTYSVGRNRLANFTATQPSQFRLARDYKEYV